MIKVGDVVDLSNPYGHYDAGIVLKILETRTGILRDGTPRDIKLEYVVEEINDNSPSCWGPTRSVGVYEACYVEKSRWVSLWKEALLGEVTIPVEKRTYSVQSKKAYDYDSDEVCKSFIMEVSVSCEGDVYREGTFSHIKDKAYYPPRKDKKS